MDRTISRMRKNGYRMIADQAWDTIAANLDMQMKLNGKAAEFRYVRDPNRTLMYFAFALDAFDASEVPTLKNAQFVGAGVNAMELSDLINDHLEEKTLPQEIRIMCSKADANAWGLFYQ